MAIHTISETGELNKQDDTLINNMIGGLRLPVLGENEVASNKSAFWGVVQYSTLATAGASMYTRQRVARGQEPIANVFF